MEGAAVSENHSIFLTWPKLYVRLYIRHCFEFALQDEGELKQLQEQHYAIYINEQVFGCNSLCLFKHKNIIIIMIII